MPQTFVLSVRLHPKSEADAKRLRQGLTVLSREEVGFYADPAEFEGPVILHANDENQLDQLVERLLRDFAVRMDVGAPDVAYRETIGAETEVAHTHQKDHGATAGFADVTMIVRPSASVNENSFASKIEEDTLPAEFLEGVEAGVASVWTSGPIQSFPVTGVAVTLTGAQFLDSASNPLAFEIAARMCVWQALRQYGILLEPIAAVSIVCPHNAVSGVISDLSSRRGHSIRRTDHSEQVRISAMVPAANMMGYINRLLSLTEGSGTFEMVFDHYAPFPKTRGPDDEPPMAAALTG